jgi:1,4-alpha-glucan branching enzyme
MLSPFDIDALVGGNHSDPFAALGLHSDDAGVLHVRAFLPGAIRVQVLETAGGKSLTSLRLVHGAGLFDGSVPRRKKFFDYRLAVQWAHAPDAPDQVLADAYAFGALIDDDVLTALSRGEHPQPYTVLGAHSMDLGEVSGVRFAVWAPNARRVSVVGSFNSWDGRRHAMRLRHATGVWEIFVPHVALGDLYKYELQGPDGALLPLKADPYARAAQLRPDTASQVALLPPVRALPDGRGQANARNAPISIYEVHVASWRAASGGGFISWDELAEILPVYVRDMGFTHIELLPVSEFPFDGSWGYQTLGLYALSARFGPMEGFWRFVQACHEMGLGVLLDWVPAHFPSDAHGLAQFDGTALYEYADPREGFHKDWNTLIYNFGRNEVRNFLAGNARYWLERHGVDGLRVDAVASMLYRDYSRNSGEWVPNVHGGRENLEAISLLQRINEAVGALAPGAITLAEESTSFPGVSRPTSGGGLGFFYKWNMGWMNDTLQYMHEDPVHRRWHHNKMSFGLVYAFSENFVLPISHDEVVHGKGSMLGKMPGDEWQRFANLRAYYGFMWGHPGKKLLFMGQEFAQADEWSHDRYLPWQLLDDSRHRGVQSLVRDLNQLYRQQPALHQRDCESHGFEWLVSDDADQSVLAWIRYGDTGIPVMVVCNFTPVPRLSYRIGVPDNLERWCEVLNTDSRHYGGGNLGNGTDVLRAEPIAAQGRSHSISLTLPPLATIFLQVA